MHQDRMLALPRVTDPPPEALRQVLQRLVGTTLTTIPTGPARVLCLLDGHEIDKRLVVGLITRGLIRETAATDQGSEYTLTKEGKRWANTEGTTDGL